MKVLHGVLGLVLFAVTTVCSAWLVYAYMALPQGTWTQLVQLFGDHPRALFTGALSTLAVAVLYVLSGSRVVTRQDRFLSFENEGGAVDISVRAVSDFLASLSDEFAAVISLKPSIRIVGDQLDVDVDLKVRAGAQVPALCQVLQQRVREVLQENLGLSDVRNIKITVRDIIKTLKEQRRGGPTATA